jgi:putative ABC transport system permease protein
MSSLGLVRRFAALIENLRMAGESIRANKLRSVLTTLGIIIGVATVIAMMGIVGGINQIVEKELTRIGANVFYVMRFPAIQISFDWRKYRSRPNLAEKDWEGIRERCPSVLDVSPQITQGSMTVSHAGESTNPDVTRIAGDSSYLRVNGLGLDEGRFFTDQEVRRKRSVCVIGRSIAERLFPHRSPLGLRVNVEGRPYRVIGVYEKLGTMFGFDRDNMVVVPVSKVNTKHDRWANVEIAVMAVKGVPLSVAMDEVRASMRISRSVKPAQEENFEIETRESIMKTYQSMTGSIFAAAVGIALISLLVGGIGIMNIMLVSVRERTREIGVRKALGARRRDILWQFLIEAMTLSVAGGLIGAGLAIGGLKLAVHYTDKLPVNISPNSVIVAFVFSMLVGVFFGVFPARKAAALDPIDSLRYE